MMESLLSIRELRVRYRTGRGHIDAVDGASFEVPRASIVGIVGESGCGKTTIAKAVLRVMAENAEITNGQMLFDGHDLAALSEREMRKRRWRDIAFVPQSAMNSLDPVYTVENQIDEVLRRRGGMGRRQSRMRCEELFELVGIDRGRLGDYPHQFSGGMRQRVAIALALALNPKLVVADEPVTALDVIVQRQILDQLRSLQQELGISVILVTHDISVVAYSCDQTVVMYAGKVVETGSTADVLMRPSHPYTMGLRNAFPDLHGPLLGQLAPIQGSPPNLLTPPPGCRFAPRCPFAEPRCRTDVPALTGADGGHQAACLRIDAADALRSEAARSETWKGNEAL